MSRFTEVWHRQTQWLRMLVSIVGVLLAYYAAPLEWSDDRLGFAVAQTLLGVALLSWVLVGQARGQLSGEKEVRLPFLATVMALVLAVFALGYFALETAQPGQLDGLRTRTDALYFTMSVLTTVGFGDIHAAGQIARGLATLQMAFDLVFVAAGGSLLASTIRSSREARTSGRDAGESSVDEGRLGDR